VIFAWQNGHSVTFGGSCSLQLKQTIVVPLSSKLTNSSDNFTKKLEFLY